MFPLSVTRRESFLATHDEECAMGDTFFRKSCYVRWRTKRFCTFRARQRKTKRRWTLSFETFLFSLLLFIFVAVTRGKGRPSWTGYWSKVSNNKFKTISINECKRGRGVDFSTTKKKLRKSVRTSRNYYKFFSFIFILQQISIFSFFFFGMWEKLFSFY